MRKSRKTGEPKSERQKASGAFDADGPEVGKTALDAEQLNQQLEQLQQERDQLYQHLQRTTADFQNYQKRTMRQQAQLIQRTQGSVLQALLPVLDDLDRAIQTAEQADQQENNPILDGIKLVRQHMLDLLGQMEVLPMDSLGKPFDPAYHEAIMDQPTDQAAPGTILQEIHCGYLFKGDMLRPARVIVARAAESNQTKADLSCQQNSENNGPSDENDENIENNGNNQ